MLPKKRTSGDDHGGPQELCAVQSNRAKITKDRGLHKRGVSLPKQVADGVYPV